MQVVVFIPEEQYNDTYVIHHDKKNWSEAQRHCREKHTDLVSGLDQLLDKKFRSKIQNHGNSFHWIGLFRDSWRWSDGSNASFRNWKSFKDDNSKKCAVTLLPSQKWESRACDQKRPFFCYRGEFNKCILFFSCIISLNGGFIYSTKCLWESEYQVAAVFLLLLSISSEVIVLVL